jgi:hypothetical protein
MERKNGRTRSTRKDYHEATVRTKAPIHLPGCFVTHVCCFHHHHARGLYTRETTLAGLPEPRNLVCYRLPGIELQLTTSVSLVIPGYTHTKSVTSSLICFLWPSHSRSSCRSESRSCSASAYFFSSVLVSFLSVSALFASWRDEARVPKLVTPCGLLSKYSLQLLLPLHQRSMRLLGIRAMSHHTTRVTHQYLILAVTESIGDGDKYTARIWTELEDGSTRDDTTSVTGILVRTDYVMDNAKV